MRKNAHIALSEMGIGDAFSILDELWKEGKPAEEVQKLEEVEILKYVSASLVLLVASYLTYLGCYMELKERGRELFMIEGSLFGADVSIDPELYLMGLRIKKLPSQKEEEG